MTNDHELDSELIKLMEAPSTETVEMTINGIHQVVNRDVLRSFELSEEEIDQFVADPDSFTSDNVYFTAMRPHLMELLARAMPGSVSRLNIDGKDVFVVGNVSVVRGLSSDGDRRITITMTVIDGDVTKQLDKLRDDPDYSPKTREIYLIDGTHRLALDLLNDLLNICLCPSLRDQIIDLVTNHNCED